MNKLMTSITLSGLLTIAAGYAHAEKPDDTAPPTTPRDGEQEQIEPEVNIIRREDKTIEEYRVNGRLYMIKVTPKGGAPYYLIDKDGNGSFESRRADNALEPDIMVPNWVLFRW